jgi:hypothetical protein
VAAPSFVVTPRWPLGYTQGGRPRCFIVMPFAQELEATQRTYRAIADEGTRIGVDTIRGDVAVRQEIIHSIWEETGQASHVLVDLTGFNPNVCLELGLADLLGKHSLLIGLAGTGDTTLSQYRQAALPSLWRTWLGRWAIRRRRPAFLRAAVTAVGSRGERRGQCHYFGPQILREGKLLRKRVGASYPLGNMLRGGDFDQSIQTAQGRLDLPSWRSVASEW